MKWCFEGSAFKIHFLIRFLSYHNEISMGNANINALYTDRLRIKMSDFFLSKFTFYKWCVTKVAHCKCDDVTNNYDDIINNCDDVINN